MPFKDFTYKTELLGVENTTVSGYGFENSFLISISLEKSEDDNKIFVNKTFIKEHYDNDLDYELEIGDFLVGECKAPISLLNRVRTK